MRTIFYACFAAALFVLTSTTAAFSYDPRIECDNKAALKRLDDAHAMEKAGKLEEAYKAAHGVAGECMVDGEGWSSESSRISDAASADARRIAKAIAIGHEKGGRLEKAVDWYSKAGSQADFERVTLAIARGFASTDCDKFERAVYNVSVPANVNVLKTLASGHTDAMLLAEETAFAKKERFGKDNYEESREAIVEALCWTQKYAEAKRGAVLNRALKRAETTLAGTAPRDLRAAENYFYSADRGSRAGDVRARAGSLGDAARKRGELELALEFYSIADDNAKAKELRALMEKTEAEQERKAAAKEGARQKTFQKEQDALEKELGL